MPLLSLSGSAGSGKTTCANHLVKELGFIELSFADPLKDALCAMFNISRTELERIKVIEEDIYGLGKNMRFMLQTLGTEWGRNTVNHNIWEILLEKRVRELYDRHNDITNIVISDVRFMNELDLVHRLGGLSIFIDASEYITQFRLKTDQTKHHESESYLADIRLKSRCRLTNSSTVSNLIQNLTAIVYQYV